MARPPPLQLRLDNMLPNLGMRSKTPFFARIYDSNWRNLVIGLTVCNAVRHFILATTAFDDEDVDNEEGFQRLAQISSALGVIYTVACLIEVFGVISVLSRKHIFIRTYAHLAFIDALQVTVAGIIIATMSFLFADDVVAECVSLSAKGELASKSLFAGDLWASDDKPFSTEQAEIFCLAAWEADAWSNVLSAFLFFMLPSTIYFLVVYTYYRQTMDPAHSASLCSPSHNRSAIRMEPYVNAPYSPLYNDNSYSDTTAKPQSLDSRSRSKSRSKAASSSRHNSPPNKRRTSASNTREIGASQGVSMASPSPYQVSPGPPSFSGPAKDDLLAYEGLPASPGYSKYI